MLPQSVTPPCTAVQSTALPLGSHSCSISSFIGVFYQKIFMEEIFEYFMNQLKTTTLQRLFIKLSEFIAM